MDKIKKLLNNNYDDLNNIINNLIKTTFLNLNISEKKILEENFHSLY